MLRAAGGPLASVAVAIAIRAAGQRNELIVDLQRLLFFGNLLVLGVGSLLPLGFTDGTTFLNWTTRRH